MITVFVNGQNISNSTYSFSSSDCSQDGSFYCNNTPVDNSAPQTYHITWTQPPQGNYQVEFNATCTSSTPNQSCNGTIETVTTAVANPVPVAVNDTATTTPGAAVPINLLANDTIPAGQQVFVKLPSTSAHGTVVNNNDGTATYTPSSGFTGTDTFSYNIVDANGNVLSTASVSVTVTAVPIATNDTANTTPGTAVKIDLLANDQIPQGQQVTVNSVTTPQHGTVVNNHDGTATYTPSSGFTGTDTFNYTLADSNGQTVSTAAVSVTVTAVPIATNDTANTTPGTAVKIDLLANDQIPQGQQVTVNSVTTPQHGTVVNNHDGTATYTPSSGFTGTDTFNYTLADSNGQTVSTAAVSVTVSSTNVGPQATDTSLESLPNLTDNQRSVATVVDQLCASSTDSEVVNVCDIISGLSGTDQLTALQQITPDQLAAQGTTAVETSTTQLTNIKLRLMSLRQGGASGLSMNGFSMGIKGNSVPMGALLATMQNRGGGGASGDILGSGRLGVFVNGRINFGSLDTTSQETGFDFNTDGITMGVDYRFTDDFVAGGALGYASTSSNYSGSGGKMDSYDVSISTYGSYYLPRDTYVDWIATYGSTNYDTTRNMVFSGLNTQAKGSTGGDQFALSINAGMDFNRRDLLFTPYARLEYTSNSIDSYQENGGSGLALGYNSQTIESLTTALAATPLQGHEHGLGHFDPQRPCGVGTPV